MSSTLKLCPIGVRGDEPMADLGWPLGITGIREAYLRGVVTIDQAREIYADPDDYQFDEGIMAWARDNQLEGSK